MTDKWHPGGSLLDAPLTYGMGLFQGSHAGVAFLEAYGATAGYRTNMAIIRELDMGIVVMSNSEEAHELGAMIKFLAIRCHLGLEIDSVLQA
jgi:CubicO group peptidase (beta-lactamase class C family)